MYNNVQMNEEMVNELMRRVTKYCPFLLLEPGEYENKQEAFISCTSYLFGTKTLTDLGREMGSVGFHQKPTLWKSIVSFYDRGNWVTNMKENFIGAVVKAFSSLPWCCYIVTISGISFACYEKIASLLGSTLQNGKLIPIVVEGIEIPNILPSKWRVKKKFLELFENSEFGKSVQALEYRRGSTPLLGYQIDLKSYLEFMLSSNAIKQVLSSDGSGILEILVNADALPVAGTNCWVVSYSLGNLGRISHSLAGRIIGNIACINDKDFDQVEFFWASNLNYINKISEDGCVFINVLGVWIKCKVVIGADDAFMRLMKGLDTNSSKLMCSYCYDMKKDWFLRSQEHIYRNTVTADAIFNLQQPKISGQIHPPMFSKVPFFGYSLCSLHCLLSLGRNLMFYLYNFNANFELENNGDQSLRKIINNYLVEYCKISYDISVLPQKKTWNVKGFKCAKLICYWPKLIQKYELLDHSRMIVGNIKRALKVLYTFKFDTPEKQADKTWYMNHSEEVFHSFSTLTSKFNYYTHSAGVHGPQLLDAHGSIYKYCNDIEETIGYCVKGSFATKTNRKKNWILQVLRRSLMPLIVCNEMNELHNYTGEHLESKEIESFFHRNHY